MFDQLAGARHFSDETIALAKMLAHWLSFGPPLMIATLPAAALLKLDGARLILTLEAWLADRHARPRGAGRSDGDADGGTEKRRARFRDCWRSPWRCRC
jgi:hypothetical protein